GPRLQEAGDPPPGREVPGEQAAPRRRADRRGGVVLREPGAFAGQPVEVRRRRHLAAVAADVAGAEVVGEDEDHGRPGCGGGPGASRGRPAGRTESVGRFMEAPSISARGVPEAFAQRLLPRRSGASRASATSWVYRTGGRRSLRPAAVQEVE